MRIVSDTKLAAVLDTLPGLPRVVAAGNVPEPAKFGEICCILDAVIV